MTKFVHLLRQDVLLTLCLEDKSLLSIVRFEDDTADIGPCFRLDEADDRDFLDYLPVSDLKSHLSESDTLFATDILLADLIGVKCIPLSDQKWDDFHSQVSGAISVLPKISLEELLEKIH